MKLLRIYAECPDATGRCQWALLEDGRDVVGGAGAIADLPPGSDRVQLVLPAARVLLTRVRIPRGSGRRGGSVLAFAVEERTVGEPEASEVICLATSGDEDILAVTDAKALASWHDALAKPGLIIDAVYCETLLLPRIDGEWSLAWNGREGFVRSGDFEGGATDSGDMLMPPLRLRQMVEEARRQGTAVATLALFTTTPKAAPDLEAWQAELGMALRLAGPWQWQTTLANPGAALPRPTRAWSIPATLVRRLRPAGWILAAALCLHALALAFDGSLLGLEQRQLRKGMEAQFRATFPDAVAVSDPALQMRRKLAQARHAAGRVDASDFAPMIALVAAAARELPSGALRTIEYGGDRLTLTLDSGEGGVIRGLEARLIQGGLGVEISPPGDRAGGRTVLVVRAP